MANALTEQVARWRSDICAWAEENIHARNPATGAVGPLCLMPHQREFLAQATRRSDDGHFAYKVACASFPKREGKTLCVAIILAWRLACFTEQKAGIIANSERQAQSNLFDAVTGFFRDSPRLRAYCGDNDFQARRLTVPALGNTVECYPANHRTVQGTRFDVLACDELHAADDGGKAYAFASQQTEAVDAQVLISSQAGAPVESNPLWRLYRAGQADSHVYFDYRTDPCTPWATSRAEKARLELTPGEYAYLWQNAWGATGLKLFVAADVEAAAVDYEEPETASEWRALVASWGLTGVACTVGFGLDRAGVSRSGDSTCFAVVAKFSPREGDAVFRVGWAKLLPTGSEAEILSVDRHAREVFGTPYSVACEYYGCSDLVEKLQGAELLAPTQQNQADIYNRLYRLFKEQRIWFPERAGFDIRSSTAGILKAQLVQFGYDTARGDDESGVRVKWKTQRGHDDAVDGVAWATKAADHSPPRNRYSWLLQDDDETDEDDNKGADAA